MFQRKILFISLLILGSFCHAGSFEDKVSVEDMKEQELSSQNNMNTMFYQSLAYDRANQAVIDSEKIYEQAAANNSSIVAGDNSINVIIQNVTGDTIAVGK